MKEERKSEYPKKNPDDELQKMPHDTKARNFKPQVETRTPTLVLVAG